MSTSPNERWRRLVFVYFLSGVASLAYEVLWVRMLALQFGVSIFGVVITVSAFMAGLGLGSLTGARWCQHWGAPLRIFAMLEGGVALFALATPGIFEQLGSWLSGEVGPRTLLSWYTVQAAVAFIVLFIPAFAMGAGFPLVLRGLAASPVSLATIYGLNTLGGACGALLPLWLLPALGWSGALICVVTLGAAIALIALGMSFSRRPAQASSAPAAARGGHARPTFPALLFYGGLGAAALMLEIGWTRLFGMILLRTEYVVAIILAVFLVGVALGSLLGRRPLAQAWLSALPALAGGAALLSLWGLPALARWAESSSPGSLASALLWQGLAIAALTLPVTLILGAWLPLLARRLAGGHAIAGAWLYGANSVGAALGAILAGFVFVPWLGTTGTIVLAALLLYVFGLYWAHTRLVWAAAPVLVLLAWPVVSLPPVKVLLPTSQPDVRDVAVHEDALAITHVVEQPDGQRLLLADLRRMDASSDPTAVVVQQNQARLPLLLHPSPRSVLFLGLGTGISASGALPFSAAKTVVGVEVSEGAIQAARQWFTPVNGSVMDQIQVVRDDARRYVRAEAARYDVIVGDLFHPDLVGRGNLLSLQQFERVRERLEPGGIFVQWLALNQFDLESLRIVLRTFRHAFPRAQIFMEGLRIALVGPRDSWPQPGSVPVLGHLAQMSEAQGNAATGGEGPWTWVGRYWGMVSASEGPLQDEWWPKIEFRLPDARYSATFDLAAVLEYLLAQRLTVQAAAEELHVSAADYPAFERAFMASELAVRGWVASLRGKAAESQRLMRMAYEANRSDRWIGFNLADEMMAAVPHFVRQGRDERGLLESILTIRPDHAGALRALWHLERKAGRGEQAATYHSRLRDISPLDREALTGVQ